MRNCTRLYYYVWHWDEYKARREDVGARCYFPINFPLTSEKAAMRLLKRFPKDGEYDGQIDCRGVYKGKGVAYCPAYWKNGKIIKQEMPK